MGIWAAEWHSINRLDGDTRHILYDKDTQLPALFHTRQQARDYITQNYGFIRDREDLRKEPHGWRVPSAVRVKIVEAQKEGM
jgi:hypothetical protein